MRLTRIRRSTDALILAAALFLCMAGARAGAAERGASKPAFLVATRDLPDPIFQESVILMLPPGSSPLVVGLIVNKPTRMGLGQLFPQSDALGKRTDKAYFGGPVDVTAPSVVLRSSKPVAGAVTVFDGVYVGLDPRLVGGVLKDLSRVRDLRVYLGRAQWAPLQLAGELKRGSWYVVPADAEEVFSARPGDLWSELVRRAEMLRAEASGSQSLPFTSVSAGLSVSEAAGRLPRRALAQGLLN